jgi:hypothetical protein
MRVANNDHHRDTKVMQGLTKYINIVPQGKDKVKIFLVFRLKRVFDDHHRDTKVMHCLTKYINIVPSEFLQVM